MPHLTDPRATYDLHGVTFRAFANGTTGATRLAAWRADFPPHSDGAAHSMTEEEVLHILSGSLEVEIDDDRFTARAGDAVLVLPGTRLRVSNTADRPASLWATTVRGMRAQMADDGARIAPPWAQ